MEDLPHVIGKLLQQLCAGEVEDHFKLAAWANTHSALPIMADMGGCYAITCAGDITVFVWDKQDDLRPEGDPRICRIVVFQAARRYPILEPFIPRRPGHAMDCRHCAGTGPIQGIPSELAQSLVCYCGGLGWLLPGEDTA